MPPIEGRKRTRSGCLECRRKRRKCDEQKPACLRCNKAKSACTWASGISFRPPNTLNNVRMGSPKQNNDVISLPNRGPKNFEILDVTESVIRDYGERTDSGDECLDGPASSHGLRRYSYKSTTSHSSLERPPKQQPGQRRSSAGDAHPTSLSGTQAFSSPAAQSSPALMMCPEVLERRHFPHVAALLQSEDSPSLWDNDIPTSQTDAAANLLFLCQTAHEPMPHGSPMPEAPPPITISLPPAADFQPADDASFTYEILAPESTFLQLQSTLRHHLFQESRSAGPSRDCTPEIGHAASTQLPTPQLDTLEISGSENAGSQVEGDDSGFITHEQEHVLWLTWVEELAPWLDKFDREKQFRNTLPILSRSHPHLKFAILAVSARQIERKKDPSGSPSGSLALYQQAIHHLLPCLSSRSTAVIASCVVLCVMEMMSCSPKAWRRHLDGCATLLQAVAIHGFSGGIEQALFWCFARMDVCSGLISSTKTLIPVSAWVPFIDLESAVRLFRVDPYSYELHANQVVFLTAHAVALLSSQVQSLPASTNIFAPMEPDDTSFCRKWRQLWRLLEQWHQDRPSEMHPVLHTDPSPRDGKPFPTVLYSNPSGISGNQLYHTATLLMLQHKPSNICLSSKPRSILHHARMIVGISASNHHHGAWTNSLQPLWIAGRLFSNNAEHEFILGVLDMIEKETGWATKWRADDLREWWGDIGG